MRKPIHITAPKPTLEEWTKHFPISKAREKELLVDEFKATLSNPEEAPVSPTGQEKRRKRASAA
jgi:hypothetical protein